MTIGECDVLVLDEILGLVDLGILDVSDVIHLIHTKPEEMELILTGRNLPEKLVGEADYISRIDIVKKQIVKLKRVSEWLTLNGRNATIKGRMKAAWEYKFKDKYLVSRRLSAHSYF